MKSKLTLLCLALAVPMAAQQYAPAPTRYTLKSVNADQTQIIYRDGDRALVDLSIPKTADHPAIHTRTIVNVPKKQTLTWDLNDPKIPCDSIGTVSDWGDPFQWFSAMVDMTGGGTPKKTGEETVKGWKTTVYSTESPDGSAKFWRENEYGLLVKSTMAPKGQEPMTMVDVQELKVGKPDPAALQVPSRCKWIQ